MEEMQALTDEGMRNKVKRQGKLAYNLERLFKRLIVYLLGSGFKKEMLKKKNPTKKNP